MNWELENDCKIAGESQMIERIISSGQSVATERVAQRGLAHWRRCASAVAWVAAATVIGHSALAQQAAAPAASNSDALEEVVVTAERRTSTVQTTAISMEALS